MSEHYLGIDVGTTAIKALVVDESGSVVGDAEAAQGLSVPKPGWSEQNPSDWWKGTVEAVRAACEQAGVSDGVAAIGLSGQMHSARCCWTSRIRFCVRRCCGTMFGLQLNAGG